MTERQLEIIEKSIKIIAEKGIQDFTTKNLAREMNFSEAAIYKHFPGKIEIIMAILDMFDEQADQALEKVMEKKVFGFNELKEIFSSRCDQFKEKPYYARIIFSEEIFQNEEYLREKIGMIMEKHKKFIFTILKQMKERGEIGQHEVLEEIATIIMGSFRLLITQWRMTDFKFDLKKRFESLFLTLKRLITQGE